MTRLGPIGVAWPPHDASQDQLACLADRLCRYTPAQRKRLHRFYERSTIRRRAGVAFQPNGEGPTTMAPFAAAADELDRGPSTADRLALYPEWASRLAESAAADALARAGASAADIDHLVCATCTGFEAPGVDVRLIRALGLPDDVSRTCIGFMGCHGALNALRVADAMVRADRGSRVLVCAVELCSIHFFYGWDAEKVLANALFADGAGAVVLDGMDGPGWRLRASGSAVLPDSRDAMTWRIGDHGFEMTLSPEVPGLIRTHLRPWAERWLGGQGLSIGDVRSWAIHPGGPSILDAVENALGLAPEATAPSRDVLVEHGNMSSPTILFILERLRAGGAAGPCVALGFGPGLAIEAALLG